MNMSEVKKAKLSLLVLILTSVLIGPHLLGSFIAYHSKPIPFKGKVVDCKEEAVITGRNQSAISIAIDIDEKIYEYRLPRWKVYSDVYYKNINKLRKLCKSNKYLSGSYIVTPTEIWRSSNRIVYLSGFSAEFNARLKKYFKVSLEYFFVVMMIVFLIFGIVFNIFKSLNLKIAFKSTRFMTSGRKRKKKNRKSLKEKRNN